MSETMGHRTQAGNARWEQLRGVTPEHKVFIIN
jgi:hypothetical protein